MTRPSPPLPVPLRAFRVVAVVRVVVAAASLAGAAVVVPRTFGAMFQRVEFGRVQRPTVPRLDVSGFGPVVAVFTTVFGLVFLGAWAFGAWKVLAGRRWAALTIGILSAYTTVSGLVSLLVLVGQRFLPRPLIAGLPAWYLLVTTAAVLVDASVVVLLVLPATRAWIRDADPPSAPPWPPGGYAPPPLGRRH